MTDITDPNSGAWMLLPVARLHGPSGVDATDDIPLQRKLLAATATRGHPQETGNLHEQRVILRERDGATLACEIYRPQSTTLLPALLYLHGGAFCFGSCEDPRQLVRRIAAAGFVVCSVEYGLAPERPFPWAVEDAVYAARWLAAEAERFGGKPGTIAVAGDSAGANLAAAAIGYLTGGLTAELDEGDLAGRSVVFSAALLLAGIYDFRALIRRGGVDPALVLFFNQAYLGSSYLRHHESPLASPILATTLGSFPPVFLAARSDDPLLPQTLAMVRASAAVDVPTTASVAMCSTGMHPVAMEAEVERALAWLLQTVHDPPPRIGSPEHPVTRALA